MSYLYTNIAGIHPWYYFDFDSMAELREQAHRLGLESVQDLGWATVPDGRVMLLCPAWKLDPESGGKELKLLVWSKDPRPLWTELMKS